LGRGGGGGPRAAARSAAPRSRACSSAGGQHHAVRRLHQRDGGAPRPERRLGLHAQAAHPAGQHGDSAGVEPGCSTGPPRAEIRQSRAKFNGWWTAATILGFLFLGGQALAWSQLNAAGVFISSNPSSSFFYVLTVAHAVHLLGGASALFYVDVQACGSVSGPAKRTVIDVSAIFWHFLDGLWLYLMVLFYVWG
jgi:hypothetical protein